MELRRLTGLIALIVLLVGLAVLVYFEIRPATHSGKTPMAAAGEATGDKMAASPGGSMAGPGGAMAPAKPAETMAAMKPAESMKSGKPADAMAGGIPADTMAAEKPSEMTAPAKPSETMAAAPAETKPAESMAAVPADGAAPPAASGEAAPGGVVAAAPPAEAAPVGPPATPPKAPAEVAAEPSGKAALPSESASAAPVAEPAKPELPAPAGEPAKPAGAAAGSPPAEAGPAVAAVEPAKPESAPAAPAAAGSPLEEAGPAVAAVEPAKPEAAPAAPPAAGEEPAAVASAPPAAPDAPAKAKSREFAAPDTAMARPAEPKAAVGAAPAGEPAKPAEPAVTAAPEAAKGGAAAPASEVAKAEPAPAQPEAAEAPPSQPETQIAKAEPLAGTGGESPAKAPPAVASASVMPTFDIVRVEPTGDAVIAGVAAPGATVEVLDAGKPVAKARANENGEWALALDRPLPPGTHDLAIRTTSQDRATMTLSDQRVAVAVPDKPTEEPLVVINTPDAASRIIEMPKARPSEVAKAGSAGKKMPAAPPVVAAAPQGPAKPAKVAEATPQEPVRLPAKGKAGPRQGDKVAALATQESGGKAPEAGPAATPGSPSTGEAMPVERPAPAPPSPGGKAIAKTGAPGAPAVVAEAGSAPAIVKPAPSQGKVAGKEAPAVESKPSKPQIIPKVVVTAVEADTAGSLFVAGTAATAEPIRVYLDGGLLGEAKPTKGGTWLLQVHHELAVGKYDIRADQLDPTSGEVMVGAEVPFEREIEVATLKPVGETGGPGGASASGAMPDLETIIVRRTDNLWRISRRMYGKGERWSTLYTANKEQIRKPRWIFPGQVFMVPAGDMTWKD